MALRLGYITGETIRSGWGGVQFEQTMGIGFYAKSTVTMLSCATLIHYTALHCTGSIEPCIPPGLVQLPACGACHAAPEHYRAMLRQICTNARCDISK